MDPDVKSLTDGFLALIQQQAKDAGLELKGDLEAVRQYTGERMQHLSQATAEPGYPLAVKAESDSVVLKLVGVGVDEADSIDGRVFSAAFGLLGMAGHALALLA